jgi:hypothetical protein
VNLKSIPQGDVAAFSQPWLSMVSDCRPDTKQGGPEPGTGELSRTRCHAGLATLYLVAYRTSADRDHARTRYLEKAGAAATLAPRAARPAQRRTPSGSSTGWYVEYANTVSYGERADQVVAGVWWNGDRTLTAGYLVAYWTEGLAGSWEPLRDLWLRYS